MVLSLRIPRVEVFWGPYNLTCYAGPDVFYDDPLVGEPLVYNVSVNLSKTGQNPTGAMTWNPTGAAYKVYENLLTKYYDHIITVRYYYVDGRSITFAFVWSGQQESYGASMELRIGLSSELDGLVNGILKSTNQVDGEDKGVTMETAVKEMTKNFGVDKYNLIAYGGNAQKDLEKAKVVRNYSVDMKFNATLEGMVENNGNTVFGSNIVSSADTTQPAAKCVIFSPYAWEKDTPVEELAVDEQYPKVTTRYGFFLGPCLIETIQKTSQWQPPQRRNIDNTNSQMRYQPPTPQPQGVGTQGSAPAQATQRAQATAAQRPGVAGIGQSKTNVRGVFKDNEDGEKKKEMLQKEGQCKLSTTLFMSPVFTGIKPYDILFIPNFSGTFMEDWVVESVEYSQTDGGVNISVNATRQFALGDFMNPTQGKIWLDKAKAYGLVGENPNLENWMAYGWKVPVPTIPSTQTGGQAPAPDTQPQPAPAPTPTGTNFSGSTLSGFAPPRDPNEGIA